MKNLPSLTVALLACAALLACSASIDGAEDVAASEAPLRIGSIQGADLRSPFEGQRVEVQGVVTGNFVSGLDGFFMQDAAGEDDGDPATSDGIFVHWPRGGLPKVRRGDRVRVAGNVVERGEGAYSQSVIEATQVAPLGRGAAAAVILTQPPAASADWERLEGMWLRISAPLTVSGNEGQLRHGELHASFGGRQFQPTERHPPGTQARVAQDDNQRRMLVLDDNRRGD
jgi:predicted extracellular nuclease